MASRERPAPALGAGDVDDPPEPTAAALAEAAEAEAVAAEAEARAAAARAHALRLRQKAAIAVDAPTASAAPPQRRWWRRPARKVPAVGAAIVLICASLAASGYMLWHHHTVSQEKERAAEFTTAARQAVTILMSLDFNKPAEDMRRIADISTGPLKDGFPAVADQLTKRLQQAEVVTQVTVNDVAVESMTDNSAIVLVAATTDTQKVRGGKEAQSWHIALSLTRDGGQPKMSNIEFVQ